MSDIQNMSLRGISEWIDDTFVSVSRTEKDVNGIYTKVEWFDSSTTLRRNSILSGGSSPTYTTRTEITFDTDGTTPLSTKVYNQVYSGDEWIGETLAGEE